MLEHENSDEHQQTARIPPCNRRTIASRADITPPQPRSQLSRSLNRQTTTNLVACSVVVATPDWAIHPQAETRVFVRVTRNTWRTTPAADVIRLTSKAVAYRPVRCCGHYGGSRGAVDDCQRTSCAAWRQDNDRKCRRGSANSAERYSASAVGTTANGSGVRRGCFTPKSIARRPIDRDFMMRTPTRSRGLGGERLVSVRS